MIYQKEKCILAIPYEENTELLYNLKDCYDPIRLSEIESYFIEESIKGFTLVVETGYDYKDRYVVDTYTTRRKAENAAKIFKI